jgi:gamma-glutamyltranspeptidase/glutathione hydrolase
MAFARSVSYGTNGMVASGSKRAAAAGLCVLQRGGNAFDAAVAVAGVEWLTLPSACGLGGDAFVVLYDARRDRVASISGSGAAARRASRERYDGQGLAKMPLRGWDSISVPGTPGACATLHREFCTMSLADLLEPAARYAEDGVAVSERASQYMATGVLKQHPATAAMYVPHGKSPRPGDLWRAPDLAATIRAYARGGSEAFYRGAIAEEIVRACREEGGLLDLDDFAAHTTEVETPLHTRYRGVDVYEPAPPSQGFMVLEWLNLLEEFDLAALGAASADTVHLLVETKKLVFADRLRYAGDPRFVASPLDDLLSPAYAARRRLAVDMNRANNTPVAGTLAESDGETSYFAVVDRDGNAVSFIHSLSAGFGSGVVAGHTGVLLNNRAGRGFTLDEGHPNVIAGGKRTMHTLLCYLLCRDGRPLAVGGTPGGDYQPQWNVQMIVDLLDFGLDPQRAAEAPRWASVPGTDPFSIDRPFAVELEAGIPGEVAAELERRGHEVRRVPDWQHAIQLIVRGDDGVLQGGSDPRAHGVALGY